MEDYYKEKNKIMIEKYDTLFRELLARKGCNEIDNDIFFHDLAYKTKEYYHEIERLINRVLFYFYEENDSAEKIDYLLRIYKTIKEEIDGK